MTIIRGMKVQASSRAIEPWMGRGISPGERRRKRIAKTTIAPAIRTEKNAEIRSRTK